MTSELEEFVAGVVEGLCERDLGNPLGPRTRRDARDGSGLRVDFTYDASDPPGALEVTSLRREDLMSAHDAAVALDAALSEVADREDLGSWLVGVTSDARIKDLRPDILRLIREGRTDFWPGDYTHVDLQRESEAGTLDHFLEEHRRLSALGLKRLVRYGTAEGRVMFMVITAGWGISGFSPLVETAVAANAEKLAEASAPGDTSRHLRKPTRRVPGPGCEPPARVARRGGCALDHPSLGSSRRPLCRVVGTPWR